VNILSHNFLQNTTLQNTNDIGTTENIVSIWPYQTCFSLICIPTARNDHIFLDKMLWTAEISAWSAYLAGRTPDPLKSVDSHWGPISLFSTLDQELTKE